MGEPGAKLDVLALHSRLTQLARVQVLEQCRTDSTCGFLPRVKKSAPNFTPLRVYDKMMPTRISDVL